MPKRPGSHVWDSIFDLKMEFLCVLLVRTWQVLYQNRVAHRGGHESVEIRVIRASVHSESCKCVFRGGSHIDNMAAGVNFLTLVQRSPQYLLPDLLLQSEKRVKIEGAASVCSWYFFLGFPIQKVHFRWTYDGHDPNFECSAYFPRLSETHRLSEARTGSRSDRTELTL